MHEKIPDESRYHTTVADDNKTLKSTLVLSKAVFAKKYFLLLVVFTLNPCIKSA